MRIVIELKRGAQAEIVLNQLYKHTSMQESFSMIFLAVANGQPKEMGLVQAIKYFIDHRIDVVRRRTAFLLQKARDREHILEGYKTRARPYRLGHRHHSRRVEPCRCSRKPGRVLQRTTIAINAPAVKGELLNKEHPFDYQAGRRHSRIAIASPDAAVHRRDYQRVGRDPRQDRRVRIDSWLRKRSCAASSSRN